MNLFHYKEGALFCEETSVRKLADDVGTPFYLYSRNTILRHFHRLDESLAGIDHIICYALKANSSLAICKLLCDAGSGAEIVSGGELQRALRVGFSPSRIVFNGNGKTADELRLAIKSDVLMINVDSKSELNLLDRIAGELSRKARVALRVNPDIDPRTHPYISTGLKENKFGIAIERAVEYYQEARELSNIEVVGVHKHIGSQIVQLSPFVESLQKMMSLVDELKRLGFALRYLDMGGGIGITYDNEQPPSFEEYVGAVRPMIEASGLTLIVEPGRVLVGNAGILVTKVLHVKSAGNKTFVVVDAAMNDLVRPSVYKAYHKIIPVEERPERGRIVADVVGGICESTDFFARSRELPEVRSGELIAILSAGAYGSSMSSNYNSRPLIPEIMVNGTDARVIRRRQTFEEMIALESF